MDAIEATALTVEAVLAPDPGTEDLFNINDNKFAFSPGQLSKLLNPKSLVVLEALGGLAGLEKGLRTNRHFGLSVDGAGLDGSVSFEEATGYKSGDKAEGVSVTPPASIPATDFRLLMTGSASSAIIGSRTRGEKLSSRSRGPLITTKFSFY